MSEWRTFKALLRNSKSDVAVLVTTFLLTVIFDLTIAIEIGLLLAVVLFLRRISETTSISVFKNDINSAEYVEGNADTEKLTLPKGVEVYEIEGPFFFGVASKFEETMKQIGDKPMIRIIRMRKVPFIDSTGLHNLTNLIKLSKKDKIHILLSGVNPQVRESLEKSGIAEMLSEENICENITEAIEKAEKYVAAHEKKKSKKTEA
jgi:SulP family sulfate permease